MSRAPRLKPDKRQRILQAILDGKKPKEIAEEEGVAAQTVRNIAASKGISLRAKERARENVTEPKRQRIIDALLAGQKSFDIAQAEGCSPTRVRAIAKASGIVIGSGRRPEQAAPNAETKGPEPEVLRGVPRNVTEAREMLGKLAGGVAVPATEHQEAALWRFIEAAKRERESTEEVEQTRRLPAKLQRLVDNLQGMENRIAREHAVCDEDDELQQEGAPA